MVVSDFPVGWKMVVGLAMGLSFPIAWKLGIPVEIIDKMFYVFGITLGLKAITDVVKIRANGKNAPTPTDPVSRTDAG